MIWIHGTELLLLPALISKRINESVDIGFYMHRSFPTSEVFRILPQKYVILNSLCSCNIIGFQFFEHAKHFTITCERILGIENSTSKDGFIRMNYYGRTISIFIGHVGILPEKALEINDDTSYIEILNQLKEKYDNKTVFLSIDNGTPLAGLTLKLEAYKKICESPKNHPNNLLFLQILIPNPEFPCICRQVVEISNEINKKLPEKRVEVIIKELTLQERYAYMKISSGLLVSTICEGLSLLPFEFLLLNEADSYGIVLSEFAGASRALSSPIIVNPFDTSALESAILKLLKNKGKNFK